METFTKEELTLEPCKYEYLDHTADVQLHAWGDSLKEAFEQCGIAMFGYMTELPTVEIKQCSEIEATGHDLDTTREQAYVYAISSAALTYTMARACASGTLYHCTCGSKPDEPPNSNFQWGGCGDNIRWGVYFAKRFIDNVEKLNVSKTRKRKRGNENDEERKNKLLKEEIAACVVKRRVLLEPREFPCDFFLWRFIKDLVYSIPIDTIEALREQVGNAATTIRTTNNRGMLERVVEESFCWRLHYCIDNLAGHFE
ncbi:hypothetical protein MTP99_010758 [Tenebrio molitor]|nr:hypothetical protein MTP99_010758 [Tenebrio molitor]